MPVPARPSPRLRGYGSPRWKSNSMTGVWPLVHSKRSTINLSDGSTGKTQACWATNSLRMSFCSVPCSLRDGHALLLGGGDKEAEEDRRRSVDGHRDGHLVERDPVEQGLHVGERGDGDAALPDLSLGAGMVGVVAHQGGKVEGDRESGLATLKQELVSPVGVFGGAEARRTAAWSRAARDTSWGECRG